MRQLETNQLDIDATLEELSVQQETEDQNYSMYVSPGDGAGSGAGLMLTRQQGQCHLSLALWAWATYEIPKKPSHFSREGGTA